MTDHLHGYVSALLSNHDWSFTWLCKCTL